MSVAGLLMAACCCETSCDGSPCEHCADGTPATFTFTLSGITLSSNELLLNSGTQCYRFTTTSDVTGTFCAIQGDPNYCKWDSGVPLAGIDTGGEECEFDDTITHTVGIQLTRISSTQFEIAIFARSFGDDFFLIFYATFDSEVCYLDGAVVNNTLTSGDVADDESDGYPFRDANAWNLGYGGTATITACCPS